MTKFFTPAKRTARKIGSAITNVASDIMSAPARMKAKSQINQDTQDVKILKRAPMYDDAPNFDDAGAPTDALKARTAAAVVKDKVTARNSKMMR